MTEKINLPLVIQMWKKGNSFWRLTRGNHGNKKVRVSNTQMDLLKFAGVEIQHLQA